MKIITKLQLLLCGAGALSVFAVEPSATFFENSEVKVFRALEKAHVKGGFHEHKMNRVMVYLQAGHQRFEFQDGRKPTMVDWKAGQVVLSAPEGMHSPENTADAPFNIIEVELKKPGDSASVNSASVNKRDALKLDGKHFKQEFENDQARALRVTLGAHESTPLIAHTGNSVAIFLTDQETRRSDAAGKVETAKHKAGEAVWEVPNTYKLENLGDKSLEMILVELRNH